MNDLDTLQAHLDAAWDELVGSGLYRRGLREAEAAYREGREQSRTYRRLEKLADSMFAAAAMLGDDDIVKHLSTIASENEEKETE